MTAKKKVKKVKVLKVTPVEPDKHHIELEVEGVAPPPEEIPTEPIEVTVQEEQIDTKGDHPVIKWLKSWW